MRDAFVFLVGAVAGSLITILLQRVADAVFRHHDGERAYQWLQKNTRDVDGQTHATTAEIAKGIGLPEDRTHNACMADQRILRWDGPPILWSVWRQSADVDFKSGTLAL